MAAKGKPYNIVPVINDRDLDEIRKKASVESNQINDKMVLLCSKPVLVDDVFKVVFFPIMTDKKGELYWCYKAEIFGFEVGGYPVALTKLEILIFLLLIFCIVLNQ